MKNDNILAVIYDEETFSNWKKEWCHSHIGVISVFSMQEAMQHFLQNKDYMLVAVFAASTEYMDWIEKARKIAMTTCVPDEDEEWRALENGADAFLHNIALSKNIVANICALIRRYVEYCHHPHLCKNAVIYKNFHLCEISRKVYVGIVEIELTTMEFDILHVLAKNYRKILSHDKIISHIWNDDLMENPKETLWAHITRLRKKLSIIPFAKNAIVTVRDIGYKLDFDL